MTEATITVKKSELLEILVELREAQKRLERLSK